VKVIITNSLPLGLIAIEELVSNEEEEPLVSTSEPADSLELLFRSIHPDPWYFTPLNFLGQGIPCYTTPYSTIPGFDWCTMIRRSVATDTSMDSTSLESTLYGGLLPPGYHSFAGAYSRASSSKPSSNMSNGVINPTNEGLASK